MISGRQMASLVVVCGGGVALWIIGAEPDVEAYGNDLGPKLLPTIATGLIVVLAAADFALALLRRSRATTGEPNPTREPDIYLGRRNVLSVLLVTAVTVGFAFVLVPLGYLTSAFLVIATLMVCIGARSPLQVGLVSVAGAVVLYAGMTFGFGALLPAFPDLAFGGRP